MAGVQAKDTFTRSNTAGNTTISNAAGWGTASNGETYTVAGGFTYTYSIASNTGKVTGTTGIEYAILGSNTQADGSILVRLQSSTASCYMGIVYRYTDINNWYRAYVGITDTTLYLEKNVAGVGTSVATATITAPTTATLYWIRLFAQGTTLKVKFWASSGSEPGTWNITTTDSSLTGAHKYGVLYACAASGNTIQFDSFEVDAITGSNTIPATVALQTTSARTITTSAALLKTDNQHTIPATATLLQTNITRTIPATTSLTGNARTIPLSAALLQTNIARTITTSVALLNPNILRTIPATAAFFITNQRTIPVTVALLKSNTSRTVTTTAALSSVNNQRTIPATATLLMPNITRSVPATSALLITNQRTLPTSAALQRLNTIRTVTAVVALQATNITRTIPATVALLLPNITRTIPATVSLNNARTIPATVALLKPNITRAIPTVAALGGASRFIPATVALLKPNNQRTIPAVADLSTPALTSGKFAVWANGTGTVTIDSFRATQYPDPALSLAPIIPRIGATSASWNSIVPTNTTLGVDVSLDGLTWTDVSAGNGNPIPGIFSQPDPTIDGFDVDTSANYTSTFRTGGTVATIAHDTANSRITLTGGTNAIYAYTAIVDNDVDFFVDTDRSDSGGMVFRFVDASNFYYLQIADSQSSGGTPNTITLAKVLANSRTQLASAAISYSIGTPADSYTVTFTRGTFHRFRITILLGVITCYVDGVQLLTYTDGSPLAVGKMALYNNGGTSRYYQLWMQQIGDIVTGSPAGDIVTGQFVYTRVRLATTNAAVTPQLLDLTTLGTSPDIAMGTLIPNVTYNSSFLNANFDDLAKQSNFNWYFKPNRSFVFRAMTTVAAPWILQSAIPGLVETVDLEADSTLELDVSNDLYRNRQTILGAQDTITPPAATFFGDGQATSITLGYPLASQPSVTLNGIAQTVGLKGTTGANWYYAVNDPILEQESTDVVLQATDLLTINYIGLFDVVVTVDDTVEQAARKLIEEGSGITEAVEDHTGEGLLLNAAITLAAQLINRYALAGRTLTFNTSRNGLEIGQTLTIFLPEHGLWDAQLIINSIDITLRQGIGDTQVYWYKIVCSELPHQQSWAKLIAAGLGLS